MKNIILFTLFLTHSLLYGELFFTPQMISTHLKGYTEEELSLIKKDLDVVRSICFEGTVESNSRFYLATAGAPGARKTTILEKFIAAHPEYQKGVYVDPDPRALRFMVHTYYARSLSPLVISMSNSYEEVIKNAYEKWRGASNYITLTLLEEAYAERKSIVHGTTSTGGHISDFFANLKKNDYQVILLLCACDDSVRYDAVEYRNKTVQFYQSSPEDAIAKGLLFPQRMGIYFALADKIYIYWSDSLSSPERLAAIWQKGHLDIQDDEALQKFIDKYEADRATLNSQGKSLPAFSSIVYP